MVWCSDWAGTGICITRSLAPTACVATTWISRDGVQPQAPTLADMLAWPCSGILRCKDGHQRDYLVLKRLDSEATLNERTEQKPAVE